MYCYSIVSESTSKCHIVPSPILSLLLKPGRSRPSRSVCLWHRWPGRPGVRWDMGCAAAGYLRESLMYCYPFFATVYCSPSVCYILTHQTNSTPETRPVLDFLSATPRDSIWAEDAGADKTGGLS